MFASKVKCGPCQCCLKTDQTENGRENMHPYTEKTKRRKEFKYTHANRTSAIVI